jgi:hypothetical protein
MEEDKNTQEELEKKITNEYKIDDNLPATHEKIYAIRIILYVIVAVWLRFFKDKDISILFASLSQKNTDDFDYIKTLLNQCKNFTVFVASTAANAALSVAYVAVSKTRTDYSDHALLSATYATRTVNCGEKAKDAAYHAAFFAANSYEEAKTFYSGVKSELAISVAKFAEDIANSEESVAAYTALFYLINAYIFIKNKKL